ncbi:hypothetical protein ACHWQZ_G008118 [Mnemiopsis leidyi]
MRKVQNQPPGTILWGYWANTMCLSGAVCLLLSSLITFHSVFATVGTKDPGTDTYWKFSAPWALLSSIAIILIEYPISKRRPKGPRRREEERPYQLELRIVHLVYYSKVFRHYIARFVLYIVLVAPLVLSFPCLLSVIFVFFGSCLYFFAGIVKQEMWHPGWADKTQKVLKELAPPSQPPPRLQDTVVANPVAR